jgi:hypothetical protein
VTVGAVPPGHLKEAGHVMVYAVPLPTSINAKLDVSPDAWTFDKVRVVMLALTVVVNTVAVFKFSVNVPAEIDTVDCLSAVFNGKNTLLLSITVLPDTLIDIFAPYELVLDTIIYIKFISG